MASRSIAVFPFPRRNPEKRFTLRFDLSANANLVWTSLLGKSQHAQCRTRDVSSRGLYLFGTFNELGVGALAVATLYLRPEGIGGPEISLVCTTRVVRVDGGETPGVALSICKYQLTAQESRLA